MRVVLLTEHLLMHKGGVEYYLKHIARQLHEGGHDVTIITSDTKGLAQELPGISLIKKRMHWPLIKPSWLPLFMFMWRFLRRGEVDVVLCGKGLFEGLLAFYLRKYTSVPYIVFTYAMEIEQWTRQRTSRAKLARALSGAVGIAYINALTRSRLLDLGARDEQLFSLPPGIAPVAVDEREVVGVLKKYGIQQPYILSVGRLIERKGFDDLICAFSALDQIRFANVTLVIVGSGPALRSLRSVAERELIRDSVIFLENVPDDELPALYRGADLFAMTPKLINGDMEGFGIVFLEAAAQATPVVATDSGGVTEAVASGVSGLVMEEGNISQIATGLTRLLADRKLRTRMGKHAYERVLTEFSWEHRVEPLLQRLRIIDESL